MKEIISGDVGRGLRIIDGHGCAPSDDPCVIDQMKTKLPREENVWPNLPAAWLLNIDIDLSTVTRYGSKNSMWSQEPSS